MPSRSRLHLTPVVVLLVAHGIASAATSCPPRTTATGAGEAGTPLNPAGQRLRSALAADGLNYVRTELPIVDRAATPSLVLLDGLPHLYYTAHRAQDGRDGASLSIGSADGLSWQHCELSFSGLPDGVGTVDPDVVLRADGTLRMYVTSLV